MRYYRWKHLLCGTADESIFYVVLQMKSSFMRYCRWKHLLCGTADESGIADESIFYAVLHIKAPLYVALQIKAFFMRNYRWKHLLCGITNEIIFYEVLQMKACLNEGIFYTVQRVRSSLLLYNRWSSPMDLFTWTCQCWLTYKELGADAVCDQEDLPGAMDEGGGRRERKWGNSVLSMRFDDGDDRWTCLLYSAKGVSKFYAAVQIKVSFISK